MGERLVTHDRPVWFHYETGGSALRHWPRYYRNGSRVVAADPSPMPRFHLWGR